MTLSQLLADRWDPPPPPPRPWRTQARPEQLPPDGDWYIWLMLAGRGWGKTRTGAEWLLEQALTYPNTEWAIVAKTIGSARDVCVSNKESGVLVCAQQGEIVRYVANPCQIDLRNGSRIYAHGSEDADRIRGYNLAGAWCDEISSWAYPDTWHEGLIPAIRSKKVKPHIVVTTTPKPKPLIKMLLARDPTNTRVVRGSTYDNVDNLAPEFIAQMHADYDGTRIGRQEMYGELLDDVEGALWTVAGVDQHRVDTPPDLHRIVIGVDPAVTSKASSDETGIVVAGVSGRGGNAQFYVLADRSGRYTPQQMATVVASEYERWAADRVVAEVNNGGDHIEATLRNAFPNIPVKQVHASKGKLIRAEPVAALYEQGRVHHVGMLAGLEDQMTSWDPTDVRTGSPDRVDALVWAVTELSSSGRGRMVVYDD